MIASTPPLVTIVVPFFNAAGYLQKAIESVLAQTYADWELLLVDDGGDDGSVDVARRYCALYPDKVRYLAHPERRNLGKCATRNLGIRAGRGEFLALLDGDDVYLPEKLERQVSLLKSSPDAIMVYGPTLYWYGWTGRAQDNRRDRQTPLGVAPGRVHRPPFLITLFLQNPGAVPCTCGVLLRRAAALAVGAFDDSSWSIYEDQVFFVKLCLHGPVLLDSGCWAKYRQHAESSCQVALARGEYHPYLPNPSRKRFLDWLLGYLRGLSVDDAELLRAYRAEYRPYRFPGLYRWLGPAPHFARQVGRCLAATLQRLRSHQAESV